ncbi:9034_t:CDS:2, partial [Racocetra persica]
MPKINENGSTSVAGGVRIDYKEEHNHRNSNIFINDGGIEITAMKYNIETVHGYATGIEESEGFMIEGGAHIRKVSVGIGNEREDVTLLGTKDTLEKSDAEKLKSGEEKRIMVTTNGSQEQSENKHQHHLFNSKEEEQKVEAVQKQDKKNESESELLFSEEKTDQIQIPPK